MGVEGEILLNESKCATGPFASVDGFGYGIEARTLVGTCYVAALPAGDVLNLPPAAQTAIHSSITAFVSQDRGHI